MRHVAELEGPHTAADGPDDSPLARMARTTPTEYWNDSCAVAELEYATARGAVGATSNPTIVGEVLAKEGAVWRPRVAEIAREHPTASDVDVTWQVVEEMAVRGAAVLEPVYRREAGRKGRLSIQTDPTFHRDPARMLEQGRRFDGLRTEYAGQVPGDGCGACGHRGGDVPGHLDQRHRVVHGAPGARRGRGGRTGSDASRFRGPGHVPG